MPGDRSLTYPYPYKTLDGTGSSSGGGGVADFSSVTTDLVQSHINKDLTLSVPSSNKKLKTEVGGSEITESTQDYFRVASTENATTFDASDGALRVDGGASVAEDLLVGGEIKTLAPAVPYTPGISIAIGTGTLTPVVAVGNYVTLGNSVAFDFLLTVNYSSAAIDALTVTNLPATNGSFFSVLTNMYCSGIEGPIALSIPPVSNYGYLVNPSTFDHNNLTGTGSFTIGGTGFIFLNTCPTFTPLLASGSGSLGTITPALGSGGYYDVNDKVTVFCMFYQFDYSGSNSTQLEFTLPTTPAFDSFTSNIVTSLLEYPMMGNVTAGSQNVKLVNPSANTNISLIGSGTGAILAVTGFYFNNNTTFTPAVSPITGSFGSINYPTKTGYRVYIGQAIFESCQMTFNYATASVTEYTVQAPKLSSSALAVVDASSENWPLTYIGGAFRFGDGSNASIIGSGNNFIRFSQMFIAGSSLSTATFYNLVLTKSTGFALESAGALSVTEDVTSQTVYVPNDFGSVADFWAPNTTHSEIRVGKARSNYEMAEIRFKENAPASSTNVMELGLYGATGDATIDGLGNVLSNNIKSGVWHPVLCGQADGNANRTISGVAITYTNQWGYYARAGDLVTIALRLDFTLVASSFPPVFITNLPYMVRGTYSCPFVQGPGVFGPVPEPVDTSYQQPFQGYVGYNGEADTVGDILSSTPYDGYTLKSYYKFASIHVPDNIVSTLSLSMPYYTTVAPAHLIMEFTYITDGTFNPLFSG